MKLKTRAAHKELDHESTRLAACLCAAVDAAIQGSAYAQRKGGELLLSSDNICSMALSLYIRRRDESKPPQQWNRREKTPAEPKVTDIAARQIDEIPAA